LLFGNIVASLKNKISISGLSGKGPTLGVIIYDQAAYYRTKPLFFRTTFEKRNLRRKIEQNIGKSLLHRLRVFWHYHIRKRLPYMRLSLILQQETRRP